MKSKRFTTVCRPTSTRRRRPTAKTSCTPTSGSSTPPRPNLSKPATDLLLDRFDFAFGRAQRFARRIDALLVSELRRAEPLLPFLFARVQSFVGAMQLAHQFFTNIVRRHGHIES